MGRLFLLEGDYNYGRLHKLTDGGGEQPFYSVVHGGAIHVIDLLLWLTGEQVIEATVLGNRIASADSKFKNHDMVVSLLRLESGAIAKVSANFGRVHPHFHAVNVYGTQATFQNDVPDARLYLVARSQRASRACDERVPWCIKAISCTASSRQS